MTAFFTQRRNKHHTANSAAISVAAKTENLNPQKNPIDTINATAAMAARLRGGETLFFSQIRFSPSCSEYISYYILRISFSQTDSLSIRLSIFSPTLRLTILQPVFTRSVKFIFYRTVKIVDLPVCVVIYRIFPVFSFPHRRAFSAVRKPHAGATPPARDRRPCPPCSFSSTQDRTDAPVPRRQDLHIPKPAPPALWKRCFPTQITGTRTCLLTSDAA